MNSTHSVLRYGLAYFLWFITLALLVMSAYTVRMTYLMLMGHWQWDSNSIRLVDQVAVLLMAIVLVTLIIVTEHLYRTAVPAARLTQVVCGILAVLWAVMVVAHMTQFLVDLSHGAIDPMLVAVFVTELTVATLLWWWRRRLQRRVRQT